MLKSSKDSGDYLGQIKNNIQEKVGVIEQALENGDLPRTKDGKIRIVELGTGGGESLRRLKNKAAGNEEVELIAVDIIPSLVASLKKEVSTEAVAADAGALPFVDESVSAVNASAVFHEVSSYGTNGHRGKNGQDKILYGKEAVIKTLGELNRVLLPGGTVAYRDVLAPAENLTQPKKVEYSRQSWRLFAEWFLKDFFDSNPRFYDGSNMELVKTDKGFALIAPIGMQREFQRHYLMFRDYLRNVKQQEFGLTMLRSVWLNETDGLKSITFALDERLAGIIDLSPFEIHDSATGKVYRGDSDKFDKLYDDLMEHFFHQLNNDVAEGNNFRALADAWKEREGTEHYIYSNMNDMLNFSNQASTETRSEYILAPKIATDIQEVPRYYYNRYLKQVADFPEKDGKQIMALKKLPKDEAIKCIQVLKESSLAKNY